MSGNSTSQWAWGNAERACFDFLNKALGTVEGVGGYLGELPRQIPLADGINAWAFEISGGGSTTLVRAANRPWGAWHMGARMTGLFTDRKLAQQTAGVIRDVLPVDTGEIAGVSRFTYTAEPVLEREVFELGNDQAEGGDARFWVLRMDFEVVFGNTDNNTGT